MELKLDYYLVPGAVFSTLLVIENQDQNRDSNHKNIVDHPTDL